MHRSAASLLVLGAVCIVGCGSGSKHVDAAQVEQGIENSLSTSSVHVTKANCPEDVKSETGATFTCSVKFSNDATGKVTVKQTGNKDFTYALKPGSVKVPGSTVEADIQKSLAAQGAKNATVTCPESIVVKVGTTATCNVSGASGAAHGTVTYTFSSAEGTVDASSVHTS
jgi:Domain of unknown function (DUF4333)